MYTFFLRVHEVIALCLEGSVIYGLTMFKMIFLGRNTPSKFLAAWSEIHFLVE